MPKREDEYWASTKEPKGRGLCPFCGSSSIYYNKHYQSWRCGKCEKSFPSPSYGPGREFGKEARWFGKTTQDVSRQEPPSSQRAWVDTEYFDTEYGTWKKMKRGTSPIGRILLAFLILILVAGASVYAYLKLSSSGGIHAPSAFTATAGNMQIALSWQNENDSDQVIIMYKTTDYPASTTDGTLLYEGNVTSYVHTNLEYGETYYYGIWSQKIADGQWEYSDKGAFASATPYWLGPNGEMVQEYVEIDGARLMGADGSDIVLFNSPQAHNPTWQELKQFLWQDTTDRHLYNETSFVCADFAEMLHNNAEKAGIRAAYVCIDLSPYSEGHALNAFNTTDRGLVYIDDTGLDYSHTFSADKTVAITEGSEYQPEPIFDSTQWESMGTVTDIWIRW